MSKARIEQSRTVVAGFLLTVVAACSSSSGGVTFTAPICSAASSGQSEC